MLLGWFPFALGLINWCPDDQPKSDKCNNDNDCEDNERCQILTDPESGKERGHCVIGGDPVS